MHHLPARRAFLIGTLAFGARPAFAQDLDTRIATAVGRAARALIDGHDIPGLAVGVTVKGRRHVFPYGVASRESGAPVTPDTLFEVGSLSKTLTATAAAYAQALGRLSLDDSPAVALPELRGTPLGSTTLLQLGTYTAGGLPLQFPDAVKDLRDAMAFYRAWTPQARPGEQRRYSNPSIGLLGHVAAVAMQRDFGEWVEAGVFPALGLRQTFIRVPPRHMQAYAWGHARTHQPIRVNPGVFDAQAYGVKTTVGDMLAFLEANIDPSGLEPALRRALGDTHVPRFRVGPMLQGLGWEQYPLPVALERLQAGNAVTMALDAHPAQVLAPAEPRGPSLFNKTGSTNGFGAYAAFVPDQRLGIVLLANRNIPNAARIEAAHAVLRQAMET